MNDKKPEFPLMFLCPICRAHLQIKEDGGMNIITFTPRDYEPNSHDLWGMGLFVFLSSLVIGFIIGRYA